MNRKLHQHRLNYVITQKPKIADKRQKILLTSEVNNNLSAVEKIANVKQVFDALGIPAITRQEINNYSNMAFNFLDKVNVQDFRKSELRSLAEELIQRIK